MNEKQNAEQSQEAREAGSELKGLVGPTFVDAHMREQIRTLKRQLAEAKEETYKAELRLKHFRRAYAEWSKLLLEP